MQDDINSGTVIVSQKIIKLPREIFLTIVSWTLVVIDILGIFCFALLLAGSLKAAGLFVLLHILSFLVALILIVAAFYAILKDSIVETTVDAHSRVMVLAGGNIIAALVVFVTSVLFLTTLTGKDSLPSILLFPISMFIECITLITSNLIRIRKLQKTKQQLDTKLGQQKISQVPIIKIRP